MRRIVILAAVVFVSLVYMTPLVATVPFTQASHIEIQERSQLAQESEVIILTEHGSKTYLGGNQWRYRSSVGEANAWNGTHYIRYVYDLENKQVTIGKITFRHGPNGIISVVLGEHIFSEIHWYAQYYNNELWNNFTFDNYEYLGVIKTNDKVTVNQRWWSANGELNVSYTYSFWNELKMRAKATNLNVQAFPVRILWAMTKINTNAIDYELIESEGIPVGVSIGDNHSIYWHDVKESMPEININPVIDRPKRRAAVVFGNISSILAQYETMDIDPTYTVSGDEDDDYWEDQYGTPAHTTTGTHIFHEYRYLNPNSRGQVRFSLSIPKDTTIVSADFYAYDIYDGSINDKSIYRIDETNVGSLEADSSIPDIDTSPTIEWQTNGVADEWTTINVTDLVQEQVNLESWQSEYYIGLAFETQLSEYPSDYSRFEDYQKTSDNHAYLEIEYIEAGAENYVDQISDIDSSADIGSHSAFANQQDAPDSTYDTLTEANAGAGIVYRGREWNFVINTAVTINKPSGTVDGDLMIAFISCEDNSLFTSSGWTEFADATSPTTHELQAFWRVADGEGSSWTFTGTHSSDDISGVVMVFYDSIGGGTWALQDEDDDYLSSSYPSSSVSVDVTSGELMVMSMSCDDDLLLDPDPEDQGMTRTYYAGVSGEGGEYTTTAISHASFYQLDGSGTETINYGFPDPTDEEIAAKIGVFSLSSAGTNFRLELEEQWTSANYSLPNEYLCIYWGTIGSEDLDINVWNSTSSSWDFLFDVSSSDSSSWTNISVSDWLTSNTFTILFNDTTVTSDSVQNTWEKDSCLLWTYADEGGPEQKTVLDTMNISSATIKGVYVVVLDTLGILSVSVFVFLKALTDILSLASTSLVIVEKLVTDTLSLSSVHSMLNVFLRTMSDTLNISSTSIVMIQKLLTDTLNLSSIESHLIVFQKLIEDTLQLGSSVSMSVFKSMSDTLNISSAHSIVSTFIRTMTDTLNISSTSIVMIQKLLTDTLNLSSIETHLIVFQKAVTDTLIISSVISKEIGKTITDTLNISSAKSFLFKMVQVDTLIIASVTTKEAQKSVSDILQIASSVDPVPSYGEGDKYKTVEDTLIFESSVSRPPNIFYELFLSSRMWGYIGPMALVIIGYIISKKEAILGALWFIVECLFIAHYLEIVEASPNYWWHIIILLLGGLFTCIYPLWDRRI